MKNYSKWSMADDPPPGNWGQNVLYAHPAARAIVFFLNAILPLWLIAQMRLPEQAIWLWWFLNVGLGRGLTGQGLGEFILRIKTARYVPDAWGVPSAFCVPGVLRALMRSSLFILDVFTFSWFVSPILERHRRTFADRICQTVSVKCPVFLPDRFGLEA